MDLQVGGTSVFRIAKSGIARFVDQPVGRDLQIEVSTTGAFHRFFSSNTSAGFQFENNATVLGTFSSVTGLGIGGGADLFLVRDAADTLAQRRGTNAQAHRWYRSFTDTSNYSRIALGWSSSTAILATEGAGTGSRGNIAFGTAALATTATAGYVMIPSSAGAPTGVPADIPTGQVALHYDTSNNKIYVYNGGWVSTAALT
jgi:hypothetical protein